MARPDPPERLQDAGRALWAAIQHDVPVAFELDARETAHLERACVVADRIAGLEAEVERDGPMVDGSRGQRVLHPALPEIRQAEFLRLRLLNAIPTLAQDEPDRARSEGSRRAQRAANARWAEHRALKAARGA